MADKVNISENKKQPPENRKLFWFFFSRAAASEGRAARSRIGESARRGHDQFWK